MTDHAKDIVYEGTKGLVFLTYKSNDVVQTERISIRTKDFTFAAWVYILPSHNRHGLICAKDRSGDGSYQFRVVVNYDRHVAIEGMGVREFPPGEYWPFPYKRR